MSHLKYKIKMSFKYHQTLILDYDKSISYELQYYVDFDLHEKNLQPNICSS
jgi:hypothetical protein